MIHNLGETNTLASHFIAEIRDIRSQRDRMRFRRNMERLGEIFAYEISKKMHYTSKAIQTPLARTSCHVLSEQPVIATILRAGIPLQNGMLNFFDGADCAFISAYRKHDSSGNFKIKLEYRAYPPLRDRVLIIADAMLATGASMALAVKTLILRSKPKEVHIVTAIACKEGLKIMQKSVPEAEIWTAAIDPELNSHSYIVPGLGDPGDLAYGPKEQN